MRAMAEFRVKLPPRVGFAMLCFVLAFLLLWPSDFRRDPMLQLRGLFWQAPRYEALYRNCADPRQNWPRADVGGVLAGMVRSNGPRFYARDDADALSFARAARPGCELAVLYRVKRRFFGRRNYPTNLERIY
jgi:hypothetical protein